MRVIAGAAKGRRLRAVAGKRVRPMTDQIREALFSTLGAGVLGAKLLDLYAGSGSVGIEAISRGAARVTFVERDPLAVETIRANLVITGFADRAEVLPWPVEKFLMAPAGELHDVVVIDPPFSLGLPSDVLESLAVGRFLAPDAPVVLRVASRMMPVQPPERFRVDAERHYGDSTLLYMSLATKES